jgi:hypothetical protein
MSGMATIFLVGIEDLLQLDLRAMAPPGVFLMVLDMTRPTLAQLSMSGAVAAVVDLDTDGATQWARDWLALQGAPPLIGLVAPSGPRWRRPLAVALAGARAIGLDRVLVKPLDATDLLVECLNAAEARTPDLGYGAMAWELAGRREA